MLTITIPSGEFWDEEQQEFIQIRGQTIQLEHSLLSLSKWEAKWCKAFLSKREKTFEETLDYIRCMTVTPNVPASIYFGLTGENIDQVNQYIDAPMTATVLAQDKRGGHSRETVTAELVYYWMITLNIPFECQKWHLNRLLTLIDLCNRKNQPPKKRGKRELMQHNAALNAARRKKWNTRG